MARASLAYLFQEDLYQFTAPVVVVLRRPWETYSSDDRELLQKILISVKVDMNAAHIVAGPAFNLESLRPLAPARVLIFGAQTDEEIAPYQDKAILGFRVIVADDLHELNDDRKKNLWVALRQMFGR